MNIQVQLTKGIEAAKTGDRTTACNIFYDIIDGDPKNEAAWLWLSYVVDSIEDRQICLENVLTINPNNDYAQRNLIHLNYLTTQTVPTTDMVPTTSVAPKASLATTTAVIGQIYKQVLPHVFPLTLTIAFWIGLGFLFFLVGIIDIIKWIGDLIQSRTFPYYITPYQLWMLIIAVIFLIFGILIFNVAWALYIKHKIGYFASIILSLFFMFVGPTVILLSKSPNYILAIFTAIMPAIILLFTLLSQAGFNHEQQLASYPKQY